MRPLGSEWVLTKQYASAFFGTSLGSFLTAEKVDTVILCGFSTSGCIRATAVDAVQHGFVPFIPRDCVADRVQAAHDANLRDIDAKYGEVRSLVEILGYLRQVQNGEHKK